MRSLQFGFSIGSLLVRRGLWAAPAKEVVQYPGDTRGSGLQATEWISTLNKITFLSLSLVPDVELRRTDTVVDRRQEAESDDLG